MISETGRTATVVVSTEKRWTIPRSTLTKSLHLGQLSVVDPLLM
jgi:hypothetical protein